MTSDQQQVLAAWFEAFVKSLRDGNPKHNALIDLKLTHSHHVSDDARDIAAESDWPEDNIRTAEALGLLHDCGRFRQIVEFRTFEDRRSFDHGEAGARLLGKTGMPDNLTPHDRDALIEGVRWHNKRTIPDTVSPAILPFISLIRDADKLDILRVIGTVVENRSFDEHPEITLTVDIDGPPGQDALDDIGRRETVAYDHVHSLADFALTELSWMYDIRFAGTYRRIFSRGHFERILSPLPDTPEIACIVADVQKHVEHRLAFPE